MNDEITKVFDEFYKECLGQVKTKTIEAIQEEVDKFSDKFEDDLKGTIPVNSGGLLKSLTKVKQPRTNWYGYNFEFKGSNKNGVPYEKIANVLNYGRPAGVSSGGVKYGEIIPRKFIYKAIKNLRKLDDAITENFENKMQELSEKA